MQTNQEQDRDREERLRQLRERVAGLERNRSRKLRHRQQGLAGPEPAGDPEELVSTGCEALDRLLVRRGLERGSLVEWLAHDRGAAAGTLAWLVAREAARRGGGIVVIDRQRRFYPPAALAWGVDPRTLAVVHVESDEDELWTVDQALRSPAVAAVWLYRDELSTRDFRRWQLAAERGGTLGLLVRPASAQGQPTWADVRWLVHPKENGAGAEQATAAGATSRESRPGASRDSWSTRGAPRERVWRLSVELARCRGGVAGQQVEVELDDVSGDLRGAGDQHETAPRSGARSVS